MQQQIFLLGSENFLPHGATKWISIFMGTCYTIVAGMKVSKGELNAESIAFLALGIGLVLYGIIVFSNNSMSPKIILTDEGLHVKTGLFVKPKEIAWSDIQAIQFGQYEIKSLSDEEWSSIHYKTLPEISKAIKHAIRKQAEKQGIDLVEPS